MVMILVCHEFIKVSTTDSAFISLRGFRGFEFC